MVKEAQHKAQDFKGNRYAAFLSYSHALDGAVAAAVQHSLQVFVKPWYKARQIRVFRDQTNLTADPSLWDAIQKALDQSGFFVLMASPEAANSPWVEQEVTYWLEHNASSRLLIVLTSGSISWDSKQGDFDWEKTNALPRSLACQFSDEPIFVDLSWVNRESDQLTLHNPRYLDAIHTLAAAVHGVEKDEIASRYVRQRRRVFAMVSLAISLIVAGLLVSITMTYRADIAQKKATQQKNIAESERQVAVSGQLAVQSELTRRQSPNLLSRSALLAIESIREKKSAEGGLALRSALQLLPLPTVSMLHEDVRLVAFSPDGQYLATGSARGNSVRLWNTTTGKEIARMQHRGWVEHLRFTPDGRILVTGESINGVALWEANSGKLITRLQLGRQSALVFSPDGRYLLGSGQSGSRYSIVLWEVASKNEIIRKTYDTFVSSIAFSPTGKHFASGGKDKILRIWATDSGKETLQVQYNGEVRNLIYSPDGKYIAVATRTSDGSDVIIWEIASRQEVGRIRHEASYNEVPSLAFSPDVAFLAISGFDNDALIWKVSTREVTRFKLGSQGSVVKFSPDGKYLVTVSKGNTAHVWSFPNGQEIYRIAHETSVSALAFSPDSKNLATANDGRAVIWNLTTHAGGTSRSYRGKPNVLAVSSDGKTLATAGDDGIARLWNISSGEVLKLLQHQGQFNGIDAVAFSVDEKFLMTTSWDRSARTWNISTGREVSRVDTTGGMNTGIFSSNGRYVAMSQITKGAPYFDSATLVWQMSTGEKTAHLKYKTGAPKKPYFSPDGHFLAVINNKTQTLMILELATGKQRVSQKFVGDINKVAFSSDSRSIVIADQAGEIRVLDVKTGREIQTISHSLPIKFVMYGQHDNSLITSDDTGGVQSWDADTGKQTASSQHDGKVVAMTLSSNGQLIATAHEGNSVKLSNHKDLQTVHVLKHEDIVWRQALAFSPNNRYLATQTENIMQIWDIATGEVIFSVSPLAKNRTLAFSPSGKYIATAGDDGIAKIYNIPTGELISEVKHAGNPVSIKHVIFSQDARYLVTGSRGLESRGYVWETSSGRELMRIEIGGEPYGIAFSSDGQTVANYDTKSDSVILWDVPKSKEIRRWKTEYNINNLVFSPDGHYLAATIAHPNHRMTLVWDLNTEKEIYRKVHSSNAISFSLDSQFLATVTVQGTAQVVELISNKEIFSITQEKSLLDVAFSPDGSYLATASTNHTAQIWELSSGKNLKVLNHNSMVKSVAFTNAGNTLITLTDDGKTWTWPLDTEELISEVCERLTRNLTWREWQQYLELGKLYQPTCSEIPVHPSAIEGYIQKAFDFANQGDIANTRYWISQAKVLKPGLSIEEITGYSFFTPGKGKELVPYGNIPVVNDKLKTVKNLGSDHQSDLEIVAQQKELIAIGMVLEAEAIELAKSDQIQAAIEKYTASGKLLKAKADFDPEAFVKHDAALALIKNAVELLKQNKILQVLAAVEKARGYDSSIGPSSEVLNKICWLGSVNGYAKQVMDTCERVVALNPTDGFYYDSRGIARALAGELQAATEDFGHFIDWVNETYPQGPPHEAQKEILSKRKKWFSELNAGRNPFDEKTIEALRNE